MIHDSEFCSISDLRDRTTSVVKSAQKTWKKIILSQNKPVGIFLSIDEYNNMKKLAFSAEPATTQDMNAYKKSSHGKDWVEAFSFLESIK